MRKPILRFLSSLPPPLLRQLFRSPLSLFKFFILFTGGSFLSAYTFTTLLYLLYAQERKEHRRRIEGGKGGGRERGRGGGGREVVMRPDWFGERKTIVRGLPVSWWRVWKVCVAVSDFFFDVQYAPLMIRNWWWRRGISSCPSLPSSLSSCPPSFVQLDVPFSSTGTCLDVYGHPPSSPCSHSLLPVIHFIYGGAWGSGDKFIYTSLAKNLQARGYVVVVPNYKKYPEVGTGRMIQEVTESLQWTKKNIRSFGGNKDEIHVMGHSAGAHLVIMGALLERQREEGEGKGKEEEKEGEEDEKVWEVRSLMLYSGVYNIHEHFKFEAGRGVEEISPMARAMGGHESFSDFSPSLLLRSYSSPSLSLPPTLIAHSPTDRIVPISSAKEMVSSLSLSSTPLSFEELECGHADVVVGLMYSDHRYHNHVMSSVVSHISSFY